MLIPSKLSRPVRLDHTVVRERLLAKLSGANNFRLALITSPAGYGKTTLISQWAAGNRQPTVTARYVRQWRKNGNMPA
ncbi:transcriptional regulator [Escherichia coli]|uniref:Transcriptional regulator n=1 Tax=Escherichia coli TaxID=562 RepID=A0A826IZK7_ECOLX|nr:transcriptional regulator [Escherichia coli]